MEKNNKNLYKGRGCVSAKFINAAENASSSFGGDPLNLVAPARSFLGKRPLYIKVCTVCKKPFTCIDGKRKTCCRACLLKSRRLASGGGYCESCSRLMEPGRECSRKCLPCSRKVMNKKRPIYEKPKNFNSSPNTFWDSSPEGVTLAHLRLCLSEAAIKNKDYDWAIKKFAKERGSDLNFVFSKLAELSLNVPRYDCSGKSQC